MSDDSINQALIKDLKTGEALAFVSARSYVLLGTNVPGKSYVQCVRDAHPHTPWPFDDRAHNGLVIKDAKGKRLLVSGLNSERFQFEEKLGEYGFTRDKWNYAYA